MSGLSLKTRERLLYLISPIGLLIVWQLLLMAGIGDRRFIPAPSDIAAIVAAVAPNPVNILMGANTGLSLSDLATLGVRRISVGSALSRAALGAFMRAAREIRETGSFGFAASAVPFAEVNALMAP